MVIAALAAACPAEPSKTIAPNVAESSHPASAPAAQADLVTKTGTIAAVDLAPMGEITDSATAAEALVEAFFGEGTVRGIKNPSLARSAAAARARADLARRLRAAGKLGDDEPLRNSVITDVRVDPRTGVVHVRARLEE